MMWDEGTWQPERDPHAGLKKGHLSFTLNGERLKGGWNFVCMHGHNKRKNWVLFKAKDNEARSNGDAGFLDRLSYSVRSGRSMEDIAAGKKPPATKKKSVPDARGLLNRLMRKYSSVQLATLIDEPPKGEGWLHEIFLLI